MAWTSNIDLIQKLYIAFYGRPADPGGLRYWASQLPDNSTANSAATRELISRFINSQEAQDRFGSPSLDSAIARIYTYAFHRDATNADKALYTGKTVVDVLVNVISVSSGPDYASLNNKLEYAKWFTAFLDPNGDGLPNDDSTGTKFYATFYGNTDATDIAAKLNLIDAANPAVKSNVLNDVISIADPGDEIKTNPPSTGQTFTLTDKLDIFTNVGSGTVNAVISSTAGETTWQVADQISGGTAGSTLNLTAVVGNTDVSTTGRATSGIENFNITFADSDNNAGKKLIVDTSTLTGAKNFTIVSANASSGDEVKFTGLTKAQKLTIKSADSDLNVTAGYKSGELSGTSDEVTVAFNGAKLGTLKINDSMTEVAETVILNAAGGASTVKKLDIISNKLKTLKVTGAGDLTVTEKIALSEFDISATKNTIDASGASGKVTLRTDLTSKLDAKGGSGTSDRLILDVASSVTTGAAISGFERVDLQASNSATVKASLITGATALNVLAGTNSNISSFILTLDSVAAGTGINIVGTGKNEAQWANGVTYKQTGASSGTNDSVTIKISNGGTAVSSSNQLTVGTLTAADIENVTVQVADFAKVAVGGTGLVASAAKTITVEAGSAEVNFGSSNNMGGANTETITASSSTGKITWGTIAATGDLTFTGSEGVDILTIGGTTSADKTQTYNLGKGNDVVTLKNQVGQATVNGEDGDDSFTVTLTTTNSTTISGLALHGGDGTDTLSIVANTGTGNTVKFDKGFSGIEKIVLKPATGSGQDFTAEFQVASGYNEAVEVTDVSGVNVTLEFKTDAGGTIDLSNFTFLGWTSGTDIIKLTGTTGNETLIGTSQADIIYGGAGADVMTGGAGADKFTFASGSESVGTTAIDRITDFVAGTDKIVLDDGSGSFFAGISLTTTTTANVNATQNIANAANLADVYAGINAIAASTASLVQVVVVTVSAGAAAGTYLYINDGNAAVSSTDDMLINITGISGTLTASDFLFG